jgi:transposase InsO family protein
VIEQITSEGHDIKTACELLEVSRAGFYDWKDRPLSATAIRQAWLTDLITEIHTASRGTYGAPRVHAELRLGRGIIVGHNQVGRLMRNAGLVGLPLKRRFKKTSRAITSEDLVNREFTRTEPDRLWVTDITEHRSREGKLYCCVVLDAHSRRVVGWSIDAAPTALLTTNALTMAIENRRPDAGLIVHADHGTQFTSWAFTDRARRSGLLPSMGTVGDCFDNAVIESFWGRMQTELLNRRRWRTRVELANAIFEYLEIFHNRQRRHSSLGMLTPIEFESQHHTRTA